MNPTAKVEKANTVPTRGSLDGKNNWLKTNAAAVAYRRKSYPSRAVPIKLAPATLLIEDGSPLCSPPNLSTSSILLLSPEPNRHLINGELMTGSTLAEAVTFVKAATGNPHRSCFS